MIQNSKILIVDDEPRMCKSLKTLLCTQSYDVQTCYSGNEALKALAKNKFDLILQDVFMEGMDGFQVFDKIRNKQINIPVIIMSGNASTDSAVTALRMGASDYLIKPFGSKELFSSVKNAICMRALKNENKVVTEKLLKSERKNRMLFQSISDAIFLVDVETLAILDTNEAAAKLYGYKREELLRLKITDLFAESDETKKDIQHFNSRSIPIRYSKKKDESFFPVEITANYFSLNKRKLNISTIRDISKRIEFEKKKTAFESQINQIWKMESIGSLAGGIAHDFNNLLFVIMGNISLAQYDIKPEIVTSKNLKAAEDACIKAKELSTRLITFAKGGDPVKKTSPIIDLLKDTVISVWKGSDIKPKFLITDTLRQVYIDKMQIKQAVHNIVVNAKEAMGDNGSFKVSCKNIDINEQRNISLNQGKYIKISFEDHGCGIPKHNLKKIFDPYFSTKDFGTNKGQGLGLAVSYSIIKKHGGLITVESEPGTGSTFSIYLQAFTVKEPILKKPKVKSVAEAPVKQHVSGKGKILLMDDEESIRSFLSKVLNRLGYDVETCIEGRETVERYKKAMESKKSFDVVILDLTNKLGMGGQETMKKLLDIDHAVKGIVITGYAQDPIVTNFKAYGFSGYLVKPATRDELSRVISEII